MPLGSAEIACRRSYSFVRNKFAIRHFSTNCANHLTNESRYEMLIDYILRPSSETISRASCGDRSLSATRSLSQSCSSIGVPL